ncbi:MAG: helix-turn-helix transcriptional regulator [Pseudomonadota bacterium]
MQLKDPDLADVAVVGIAEVYENEVVPLHSHARGQLMFAQSGVMTVNAGDGIWVLPPTRALFVPAGSSHSLQVSGRIDLATLYMDIVSSALLEWPECRVIDINPLLRQVILRLAQADWHYTESDPETRLLHVLFDELHGQQSQPLHLRTPLDDRARRFCTHMQNNIDDRRLLEDIARGLGTTLRTLERCFQREIKMSVGVWVQQLRLLVAIQRLVAGASVSDVSFEVGYSNPSAFIAAFKKAFGASPRRYLNL